MIEEFLKDKKFMKLIGCAEVMVDVLESETKKGSLIRLYKTADDIREVVNNVNKRLEIDKLKFYNRIFERALDRSIKELEKDYHQSEIYFLQNLLSHIRSL